MLYVYGFGWCIRAVRGGIGLKNSKSAAGYIVLACLLYAAFLGEAVLLWGSALPAAVLIGAAGIWLLAW